jgi:hypothetical protein
MPMMSRTYPLQTAFITSLEPSMMSKLIPSMTSLLVIRTPAPELEWDKQLGILRSTLLTVGLFWDPPLLDHRVEHFGGFLRILQTRRVRHPATCLQSSPLLVGFW